MTLVFYSYTVYYVSVTCIYLAEKVENKAHKAPDASFYLLDRSYGGMINLASSGFDWLNRSIFIDLHVTGWPTE